MPSVWTSQEYWQELRGKDCHVTLEQRPHYCDRGNWIAKVWLNDPTSPGAIELGLDWSDAWPRYYMDAARAKLEIEDWMKKRKQWI